MPYNKKSKPSKKLTLADLTRNVPDNVAKALHFGSESPRFDSLTDRAAKSPANGLDDLFHGGKNDATPSHSLPDLLDPTGILRRTGTKAKIQKVAKQTNISTQKEDDLNSLLSELTNSIGSGGSSYDYESALQSGADAIRKAYGAEIGAVNRGNERAKVQTARGNKEINAMYAALRRSYQKASKRETGQGKKLADQITSVAKNAGNTIQSSADKNLAQQAQMAKDLGVEAALPSVTAAQRSNVQQQVTQAATRGQKDAQTQLGFSGSQRRFLNRGGEGALLEGTNKRAGLIADLQDYLQGNQDKIAGLRGQQARDLASNKQSTMAAAAKAASDAQDDTWSKLQDIAKLKLNIEDTRADNKRADLGLKLKGQNKSSEPSPFPKNMQNMASILGQTSNPTRNTGLMNRILSSEDFAQGRFKAPNGDIIKMTPTQAANEAEREARKNGVKEKDIPMIRLAAMAYVQG